MENTSWFEPYCGLATEKTYSRNQIYSILGEQITTIGLVISGKASAFSYSANGQETWVGEYVEGQLIGLDALIDQEDSLFEIRVHKPLKTLEVPTSSFLDLMSSNTELCEFVAKKLALSLRESSINLIHVNTLSVRGRICVELLRQALPIGIDPDRQIIRPSPVFVELAQRLNSTRETVSRTVNDLQNKGILARHPGAIIIEQSERLREAVDLI